MPPPASPLPHITFERVTAVHRDIILKWLDTPHVKEFWDNSPEHRQDIDHFIGGRVGPSPCFDGIMTYWIGSIEGDPFCFLLTSEMRADEGLPETHKPFLSQTGKTASIDFCIGNKAYLGKGLAALTLKAFMKFFTQVIDPETDTFMIDPDENNPRAKHVYEKAGFREVADFIMEEGHFKGQRTYLMTRRVYPDPRLVPATRGDAETLQNLGRFYVYDMSRVSGELEGWEISANGLFECVDLKKYILENDRHAFLIKVGDELAGYVLIHSHDEKADWVLGEFFVIAKFQGRGIGKAMAFEIFDKFPGQWKCSAMPQNTPARAFWKKVIDDYTGGRYTEEIESVTSPSQKDPHPMIVWRFQSPR